MSTSLAPKLGTSNTFENLEYRNIFNQSVNDDDAFAIIISQNTNASDEQIVLTPSTFAKSLECSKVFVDGIDYSIKPDCRWVLSGNDEDNHVSSDGGNFNYDDSSYETNSLLGCKAKPKLRKRPGDQKITIERLQTLMHLPISEAADQLYLGATTFKKVCRNFGIKMWPSRQISSIMKCITTLDTLKADLITEDEKYKEYSEKVNDLNNEIQSIKFQATKKNGLSLTKKYAELPKLSDSINYIHPRRRKYKRSKTFKFPSTTPDITKVNNEIILDFNLHQSPRASSASTSTSSSIERFNTNPEVSIASSDVVVTRKSSRIAEKHSKISEVDVLGNKQAAKTLVSSNGSFNSLVSNGLLPRPTIMLPKVMRFIGINELKRFNEGDKNDDIDPSLIVKKKRGRKKKIVVQDSNATETLTCEATNGIQLDGVASSASTHTRKRGRRKNIHIPATISPIQDNCSKTGYLMNTSNSGQVLLPGSSMRCLSSLSLPLTPSIYESDFTTHSLSPIFANDLLTMSPNDMNSSLQTRKSRLLALPSTSTSTSSSIDYAAKTYPANHEYDWLSIKTMHMNNTLKLPPLKVTIRTRRHNEIALLEPNIFEQFDIDMFPKLLVTSYDHVISLANTGVPA